jgi:hypothetical protein
MLAGCWPRPGRRDWNAMGNWLETYKPAASLRVHLLLAALLWSVVGSLFLTFGAKWTWQAGGSWTPILLIVSMAAGLAKYRLVLYRAADRAIERICARGDGRCIGGFLSVRTWLFVAVMASAGRVLRGGVLPRLVAGVIYVAVGTALLAGCRRFWQAWRSERARQ